MASTVHIDRFAQQHLPPLAAWPVLDFSATTLLYPAQMNCVEELLGPPALQQFANNTAIITARQRWSYAELAAEVDRYAHVLQEDLAVRPGMRVMLRSANSAEMAIALLATIKIGAIAVPSMPQLRARELAQMLEKAQVNCILCSTSLLAEMRLAMAMAMSDAVLARLDDEKVGELEELPSICTLAQGKSGACPSFASQQDDICLLSFTSGTSGQPKATMHFQRDLLAICDLFPRSHLQLTSDDVCIGTPSLAFTFGLGALLLFPLRYGAASILHSYANAEQFWQFACQQRATISFSAPTFYRKLALHMPAQQPCLRLAVSAGEALPATIRQRWQQATAIDLIDGLGATEMLHIFIANLPGQTRAGAIGQAIAGYQVRILDEDGAACAPGVAGRLAVRGPTGCRYLADARQHNYVQDGWNLTGDICQMDADGYVYYLARGDDMIISSGYNIAPREVEEVLQLHPAVQECAVVGLHDAERGQQVTAFVVLQAAQIASVELATHLQDYLKSQLAPYKSPRQIHFLTSLPRTENGKLQRFALRAEHEQTALEPAA